MPKTPSQEILQSIEALQKRIDYVFKNADILRTAITHSSFANEEKQTNGAEAPNNERLEFLGDAVLELVTSRFIYESFPDMKEGEMTKYRASIVCEPTLAACARDFELQNYLLLGKGEEATGGRHRDSIISDALEALIGAIYLDSGIKEAQSFIMKYILSDIDNKRLFYDSKSNLQEVMQTLGRELIYEEIAEEGPQHEKEFTMEVRSPEFFCLRAKGHSKKAAQQKCAYEALILLKEKGINVFKKFGDTGI